MESQLIITLIIGILVLVTYLSTRWQIQENRKAFELQITRQQDTINQLHLQINSLKSYSEVFKPEVFKEYLETLSDNKKAALLQELQEESQKIASQEMAQFRKTLIKYLDIIRKNLNAQDPESVLDLFKVIDEEQKQTSSNGQSHH